MTDVFAAAVLDTLPGPKYVSALRYAELSFRAPWPKAPTLKRARFSFPEGFRAGLRLPTAAVVSKRGPLRFDEEMETSFAWSLTAADALAAKVVLLITPVEATPGARDRELLKEFVARLPRVDDRLYAWSPSGLWEQPDAERVAADLGLVLACDPLEMPIPSGPVAYCRLNALGGRTRFSEPMLQQVLDRLDEVGTQTAFVALDSARSFEQAQALATLAQSFAAAHE